MSIPIKEKIHPFPHDGGATQEKYVEWKELYVKIDRYFCSLDEENRGLLFKRYYANISIKDLSEIYEVSEATIRRRLTPLIQDLNALQGS